MKYDLLIRNARRCDAVTGAPVICTMAVKDGKIAAFLPRDDESASADVEIDGRGKHILPGLIDLHVHFRDPGFTEKEDIQSGSECAAAGGVTSVFCMPNTKPVCDSPDVLAYIRDKALQAKCRIFPVAAITKGLESTEICDLPALAKAGAAAFSDDGKPVMTAAMLRSAMKIAAENDLLFMSHCEEMTLAGGAMNEGSVSRMLNLPGTPNICEDIATMRDIALAEDTGCRLHICHVSTRGSLEAIRRAKARGVRVTAETCPHYFSLTDEDVVYYGANAKMNPPLRTREDVAAVIDAIRDGTIDCISTDHAPHTEAEKSVGVLKAPNGIIGLQTSFVVSYTNLVVPGHISLARLLELMARYPAHLTGLDAMRLGTLETGAPADFSLATLGTENTMTKQSLRGKSSNTPFLGMTFDARIDATYLSGRLVYGEPADEDGTISDVPKHPHF